MLKKISEIWKEIVAEGRWLTVSNLLTMVRIVLIPFIVIGIIYHSWRFVFLLLLVAALTDVLDGYLARLFDKRTTLGACLDPIADKLFLISIFTTLAFIDSPSFLIPSWFVFLVLIREAIILGGSFILLLLGIHLKVAPSVAGKLTTFFQLTFILWLFVCNFAGWNPTKTYFVLLILLSIFSIASLVEYAAIGIRYLKNKNKIS